MRSALAWHFVLAALLPVTALGSKTYAGTCLRGVNIAGGEFGDLGGRYGQSYIYPSDTTLDWAADEGMTAIRLPFRWERLQPDLFGPFDPAELARLQVTVQAANSRGLIVILDLHNYAEYAGVRMGNGDVTADAVVDFWRRFASWFKDNDKIVFGLMNEPIEVTASDWFEAAQASLNVIREAGATQLVLVPGTIWTGASHWFDDQEGGSNADVFQNLADPANNFAFEVHQYLDDDYSGTNATCPRAADAIAALDGVKAWLDRHGFKGFVGEFGGTASADCLAGLADMTGYLNSNPATWIGWTAWAAGEWWGDYPLSLQPTPDGNRPQMEALRPNLNIPLGQCG